MTRRALVLFGLMSLIWGIPYLFIRVAVAEVSPATLVFARSAIAAVILLPIALLRGGLRPVLQRWRWVVAFAAAEIGLPWVLLASAEQRVTSSLAGLLVAGVPLVGTVVAAAGRLFWIRGRLSQNPAPHLGRYRARTRPHGNCHSFRQIFDVPEHPH